MKNKLINHNRNHHHRLLPQTITTRTNLHIQSCAACRYQRRKCAPDCILAPYFPLDRQRQFQNAHKLFGVSNITKIVRNLDRPQKDEAMRTIIYQSDVRAQDPVGGCYRIIRELHRQIEMSRVELEIVLQQLALCRTVGVQNNQQFGNDPTVINEIDYDIQQEYKDQDEFVLGKQDSVWEDKNVVEPIQSWAAVTDSPPSAQPLHTLHASVCDDFKSLLINENEPREENLFDKRNPKGLIKVENVCYNEEEYEMKNASFGIITADCKDIQVQGE